MLEVNDSKKSLRQWTPLLEKRHKLPIDVEEYTVFCVYSLQHNELRFVVRQKGDKVSMEVYQEAGSYYYQWEGLKKHTKEFDSAAEAEAYLLEWFDTPEWKAEFIPENRIEYSSREGVMLC